jgi:hypothetical protein
MAANVASVSRAIRSFLSHQATLRTNSIMPAGAHTTDVPRVRESSERRGRGGNAASPEAARLIIVTTGVDARVRVVPRQLASRGGDAFGQHAAPVRQAPSGDDGRADSGEKNSSESSAEFDGFRLV